MHSFARALAAALFVLASHLAVGGSVTDEAASSGSSSSRECEALGFTGLGLCSDCQQLESYVKDSKLVEECLRCCVKDEGEAGGQKFTSALLEVCSRRVMHYPDILTFIQDKATAFPGLKVLYKIGAAPKLIMKDGSSGEQEVVRIDNWKTENIEQFLQEKLIVASD